MHESRLKYSKGCAIHPTYHLARFDIKPDIVGYLSTQVLHRVTRMIILKFLSPHNPCQKESEANDNQYIIISFSTPALA